MVGYYSIRERHDFDPTPEEIELAKAIRQTGSVVLLIERRADGPAEGAICFWRDDVFVSNLPLPFPIDATLLRNREAPAAGRPVSAKRILDLALIAAGILAGVGLGAVLPKLPHQRSVGIAASNRAAQPAAVVRASQPRNRLEISWDPRSQAISTATAGLLHIDDGGVKYQISLDPSQLGIGTVLYAPASDRVEIELTALQKDGRRAKALATARPVSPPPAPTEVAMAPARTPAAEPPPTVETKVAPETVPPAKTVPLKPFTLANADRVEVIAPMVIEPPAVALRPAAGGPIPLTPVLPNSAPGARAAAHRPCHTTRRPAHLDRNSPAARGGGVGRPRGVNWIPQRRAAGCSGESDDLPGGILRPWPGGLHHRCGAPSQGRTPERRERVEPDQLHLGSRTGEPGRRPGVAEPEQSVQPPGGAQ